jgi:hypothetical protein
MDQKKKLLIGLLVFWGALLFYRALFSEDPQRAPMKYVKGAVQTAKREEGGSSMKIQTELLNQAPPPLPGEVKNIFAPIPSPKPPAPPVPVAPRPLPPPPTAPVLPPPPVVTGPTPEELALARARAELAEIRYLGFLDRGNGKQEGFFSRRQETVIGEKGGLLFSRFLIRELSSSVAILADKETKAEVTLQLSEGRNER